MNIYHINLHSLPEINDQLSLCLGYFDGLHLGHLSLIKQSLKSEYHPALLTFEGSLFFKNKQHVLSGNDKEKILASLGIEYLFILEFNDELMRLSPFDFIEKIILKLNVREVIVGEDFTFGYLAKGNNQTLKQYSSFKTIIVNEVRYHEHKISTSDIIQYIKNGNITEANRLLGRFYFVEGEVVRGFHVGSRNNYPTININLGNYVVPRFGVYCVLVEIDNKIYIGMANVGIHPTINELSSPILEVHIFSFNQELYYQTVKVYFINFIREEKKFTSIEELKKQLLSDEKSCKLSLEKYGDYQKYIVPFIGVNNYQFNESLEDIKKYITDNFNLHYLEHAFENNYQLTIIINNDFELLFINNQLKEILILTDRFSLFNELKTGISYIDATKLDPSLIKTNLEDTYLSNYGYGVVVRNNKIYAIKIYEMKYFKDFVLR